MDKIDYAMSNGVYSEIRLMKTMPAMDYYRLLSAHIDKIEEIERINKESERNSKRKS